MNKLLFIMQSYPSARSANVYCDDMIIQQLLKTRNIEIHILCMRYSNQMPEETINGIHIHRFRVGPYFEFKDDALKHPGSAKEKFLNKIDSVVLRANQILTIPIYPCYYPFRTRRYIKEAFRLQREYLFDAVACEHFGYETMMAGYSLKKKYPRIKYLQFFWDALSCGTIPRYLPTRYIDGRRMRVEKDVLETCDISVAMVSHRSQLELHDYASEAYRMGKLRYLGLPKLANENEAYDEEMESDLFDESKFNIVFSGNTYARNLPFIAQILSKMEFNDVVVWVITGNDRVKLIEECKMAGQQMRFLPYMPQEKLVALLVNADALLNLGNGDPNAIPSKVIQYMGCCRPIISTYSIDGDASAKVLRDYPIKLLLDERCEDFSSLAQTLRDFLSLSRNEIIDFSDIETKYWSFTPEAYCELFDEAFEDSFGRN